jgi:hypothetical protein
MLPASILQRYEVVIDYRARTLTFGAPHSVHGQGVPVPFRINPKTGLIVVDASADGQRYPITIDNGSAYTWIRQNTGAAWIAAHPGWERGVGAVGPSNMMMSGDTTETAGRLLRIPELSIGQRLVLRRVGVLAAGPSGKITGDVDLFDWYSRKNPEPVIGWIGGNILKAFRLTIDYPNRVMYWLKQDALDAHDLDQIGLTLQSEGNSYIVAGIATRHGEPPSTGSGQATGFFGSATSTCHARPGARFTARCTGRPAPRGS